MSWKVYRPVKGATIPPNEMVLGVRKQGDKLFAAFIIGQDLAENFGISGGDQVDVARGDRGDAGLVRISKNGALKVRATKAGQALHVYVDASFFGIDRKYKDQRCPGARHGPNGELFAQLPAFARKNLPDAPDAGDEDAS